MRPTRLKKTPPTAKEQPGASRGNYSMTAAAELGDTTGASAAHFIYLKFAEPCLSSLLVGGLA